MANIPPSRVKYFQNHPTVAIRLSIHLRDELMEYAQAHGMTLPALVQKLFKDQKENLGNFHEGYIFGYNTATLKDNLETTCAKCGRPVKVSQDEVVQIMQRFLNVSHSKCPYCDEEREVTASKTQDSNSRASATRAKSANSESAFEQAVH